jgi:hypothetical protein
MSTRRYVATSTTNLVVGALPVYNGLDFSNLVPGANGTALTSDPTSPTGTSWLPVAGGPTLSNALPQPVGIAHPGSSNEASRADHVHVFPPLALDQLSDVNAPTPSDTQALIYDAATSTWVAGVPALAPPGFTISSGLGYRALTVTAPGEDLVMGPTGTGAIQAAIADGTTSGGDARGDNAVDWQTVRSAATQVASGTESTVGGGRNNRASGAQSTVGGGQSNVASGDRATVAGGASNAASGDRATVGGGSSNGATADYATVGGGQQNTASQQYATVGGGQQNTASQQYATVGGGGQTNTASGQYATVAGGQNNGATADYATVPGGLQGLADRYGMLSHASGMFSAGGDAQYSRMILRRQTTDATPTVLTADGGAGSATTRVTLPSNNTSLQFRVEVSAIQTGGTSGTISDSAWRSLVGGINRNNSGLTALIGSVTLLSSGASAGASTWAVTVTADSANSCLQVQVTGQANKTIRWVATVHITQVR